MLLRPLARLWERRARTRRSGICPLKFDIPTICIGNLVVGGAGKTPTTIGLARQLAADAAHIVSRGYGGSLEGPVLVDMALHGAHHVGDEAGLLASAAPVWVAHDRKAGAQAAVAAGARAILFDDGHQTPGLAYDLSLLVVDAEVGFGNGLTMPAGPLREGLDDGLARADLVIAIGSEVQRLRFLDDWNHRLCQPVTGAEMHLSGRIDQLQGMRVAAFAGIGRPEKFFALLRRAGAEVLHCWPFSDHHGPSQQQLTRMAAKASACHAQLVATEKDMARLSPYWREQIRAVPVEIKFAEWPVIADHLRAIGLTPVP